MTSGHELGCGETKEEKFLGFEDHDRLVQSNESPLSVIDYSWASLLAELLQRSWSGKFGAFMRPPSPHSLSNTQLPAPFWCPCMTRKTPETETQKSLGFSFSKQKAFAESGLLHNFLFWGEEILFIFSASWLTSFRQSALISPKENSSAQKNKD